VWEIGINMSRFPTESHLTLPKNNESAGKHRSNRRKHEERSALAEKPPSSNAPGRPRAPREATSKAQYLRLRSRRGQRRPSPLSLLPSSPPLITCSKTAPIYQDLGANQLRQPRKSQASSATRQPSAKPWIRRPDHSHGGLVLDVFLPRRAAAAHSRRTSFGTAKITRRLIPIRCCLHRRLCRSRQSRLL
jgi:hypothetical protein